MIYKIVGTVLIIAGLLIIAKFNQYLIGLLLMFIGFYLAMKKGMKPV